MKNNEKEFSTSFILYGDLKKMLIDCLEGAIKNQNEQIDILKDYYRDKPCLSIKKRIAHCKSLIAWAKGQLKKYASKLLTQLSITVKLNEFDALMFYDAFTATEFENHFWATLGEIDKHLIA